MPNDIDLIGVDGTSSGWIASIGSSQSKMVSTITFSKTLDKLLFDYPDSVVVIDMPIELNKKNYLFNELMSMGSQIWITTTETDNFLKKYDNVYYYELKSGIKN